MIKENRVLYFSAKTAIYFLTLLYIQQNFTMIEKYVIFYKCGIQTTKYGTQQTFTKTSVIIIVIVFHKV